jgi:hypothetical protein
MHTLCSLTTSPLVYKGLALRTCITVHHRSSFPLYRLHTRHPSCDALMRNLGTVAMTSESFVVEFTRVPFTPTNLSEWPNSSIAVSARSATAHDPVTTRFTSYNLHLLQTEHISAMSENEDAGRFVYTEEMQQMLSTSLGKCRASGPKAVAQVLKRQMRRPRATPAKAPRKARPLRVSARLILTLRSYPRSQGVSLQISNSQA